MPKPGRSRKLSRSALVSEARELFSQKGYRATTLKDLVSRFGVSSPSVYYYFKNKRDILIELHSLAFDELDKNFDEILLCNVPTKEKFENILRNHAFVVATNANLVKIFFQESHEMPENKRIEISKKRADYADKMIKLYKKGIKEGVFKKTEPKAAVYIMLGACNWLCMWYQDKKDISPEKIVGQITKILREGYEL